MDYIDRIKKLKNEKKITNERLSELTGIPLGTLSKILAGISDSPKLINIIAIAEALECSVDYLVSGEPRNTNNFTLSADEISLIESYRALDGFGQDIVRMIVDKEGERVGAYGSPDLSVSEKSEKKKVQSGAKILPPVASPAAYAPRIGKRSLLLYDLPVSAGPGVYLDDTTAESINIPDNEKTQIADYALRISGNSMEPKYHDGDVLLVENCDSVEIGELGIFILDGNGYFKKYGGDTLISLNPEYGEILLKEYAEAVCCGRVVGKLKKK
ncbi:MAG: LexA family transcriptional regulator [Clostridia bacterium]|nr:LexA family transcriptional regulator [Clostridia bacterium]